MDRPAFKKCLLSHPGVEGLIIINDRIKNLWVRLEGDLCAGVVGAAHNAHLLGDIPLENFIS